MCHQHNTGFFDNFTGKDMVDTLIALSALAVSIVTYVVNKKISFKKTVKDRQLEVVYELIGLLSKNEINFMTRNKGNSSMDGMSLYHLTYTNFKEKNPHLFNRNYMFFQADSYDGFNFLQLMGNPFLPDEIYTAIDSFYYKKPKQYTFKEVEATEDYVALITMNQKTDVLNYYTSDIQTHKSFEDFHSLVVNLYKTVNNWLDKYEAGDLKFKLDRKLNG